MDDLPIYNFYKIRETEDMQYMCQSGYNPKYSAILKKKWNVISETYINEHAFQGVAKVFYKQKQLALKEIDYIISGDRFKLNYVERVKKELENLYKRGGEKDDSLYKIASVLNKMGYSVDVKRTSCTEFFTYVDLIKEDGN